MIKIKKLLGLAKTDFVKNFLYSSSGTLIGILLQVLLGPVLSRIYSPVAYGIFAAYNAVTVNVSTVLTLKLDQAYFIPKQEHDRNILICTSLLISTVLFLAFFAVYLLLPGSVIETLGWAKYSFLYWLLPVSVYVTTLFLCFGNVMVVLKKFKEGLKFGVPISITSKIISVSYGLITKGGSLGFIYSDFFTKVASLILRFTLVPLHTFSYFRQLNKATVLEVLKTYKRYPLGEMPNVWINLLSSQLPIIFITNYFGLNYLGQIGLATSLLDLGMRLFGNSFVPVFTQKASTILNDEKALASALEKTSMTLGGIGFVAYYSLAILAPFLFPIVFGKQWDQSGQIATALALSYVFTMYSYPFTIILTLKGKQFQSLLITITGLALRSIALALGCIVFKDFILSMILFAIATSIQHFISTFYTGKTFVRDTLVRSLALQALFVAGYVVVIFVL